MQGCRHQPAELDLCDFLQNEKENKAYSDKYANLNFKAFIKIIMKTKIQSRWEEPKEEEKKKVSLLYNIPSLNTNICSGDVTDSQRLLH